MVGWAAEPCKNGWLDASIYGIIFFRIAFILSIIWVQLGVQKQYGKYENTIVLMEFKHQCGLLNC